MLDDATRLTRSGRLADATASIQRALSGLPSTVMPEREGNAGGDAGPSAPKARGYSRTADFANASAGGSTGKVIDAAFRVIRRTREESGTDTPSRRPYPQPASDFQAQVAPVHGAAASARLKKSTFTSGVFAGPAGSRPYKLFTPSEPAVSPPLVVMLHGCKQDPDDFAAGTRMNMVAAEAGAYVLYPAQGPRSNMMKCWNWFQPGDQQRGGGEPEMLAAMTREVMATHAIDPARVYVAGLSAGAAMAAILGREYPDLFAAIGVHSGLAPGSAHDVASAFAVMKSGPATAPARKGRGGTKSASPRGEQKAVGTPMPAAPVIVFHGTRDDTVHPSNGEQVAGFDDAGASDFDVKASESEVAGRRVTRQLVRRRGAVVAEHWLVHEGGHAWSGGSAEGSYTDAKGPDASREMLRFFLARKNPNS